MIKKYRMIYDENLCIGCQSCSIACRVENSVSDSFFRLQVRMETRGIFPSLSMQFSRHACVMCENAPCVSVCPTHASFQTKDGLTHIDERLCISCKYCIVACPYEARFINPHTKAVEKGTAKSIFTPNLKMAGKNVKKIGVRAIKTGYICFAWTSGLEN